MRQASTSSNRMDAMATTGPPISGLVGRIIQSTRLNSGVRAFAISRLDDDGADPFDLGAVEDHASGLPRAEERRPGRFARVRSWLCSGRTARARRRSSTSCAALSPRAAGEVRVDGHDIARDYRAGTLADRPRPPGADHRRVRDRVGDSQFQPRAVRTRLRDPGLIDKLLRVSRCGIGAEAGS